MKELEKADKVETICRHCIFAQRLPSGEQYGCTMDMLDVFTAQGIELVEYEDEDDSTYFGIPGRVCIYNRNKAWLDKQIDTDTDTLLEVILKELQLKMTALVYVDGECTEEDIHTTVASLLNNTVRPYQIIFIFNETGFRPSQMRTFLNGICENVEWRAEFITEDADIYRCIDICLKKIKTVYFCVWNAGTIVPNDFFSSIDAALNQKFIRFLMLIPLDDSLNGLVLQTMLARQIGGSQDRNVIAKIEHVTEVQECPTLVKDVTTIVPSLNP